MVEFPVEKRKEYQQWEHLEGFSVEEIGRHNYEHLVDIETWSRASGSPVPNSCQIPFAYPRKSLPLSLKLDRWVENRSRYVLDVTNSHLFKFEVELPPKEIPEFIPEFFSIGKVLTWAVREQFNLGQVDFFMISCALRDIASTASLGRKGDWEYAVVCNKGKIFIEQIVHDSQRYWTDGLDDPPGHDYWRSLENPPIRPVQGKNDPEEMTYVIPDFDYPDDTKRHWELMKYGKKFEDVLRSEGPGNPLYNGEDKKMKWAKSNKLLTLGDHKIITATRLSCQEPNGPIDSQENMVEIKTMFPLSKERFSQMKALSLWIHCALVGIDAVYCGFRHMNGQLIGIRKFTMTELAELGKDYWSPNEILVFLDTFLSWMKEKLNKDSVRNKEEAWLEDELNRDEGAMFTLSYSGDEYIRLEKDEHPELRKIVTERYSWT